ncbi:hypothetical protein DERP_011984 [Dermatophagoides pteronyssinus]|uniref:Uncharacterized protein n=1 Tax=Dermatophagoides pteronyssinus TaxID=6956 RepID=A0ABQ8IVI6_DERPT|nr:hypothetical protein DERP_011984 [Dermatophagoides pteronyssinus]
MIMMIVDTNCYILSNSSSSIDGGGGGGGGGGGNKCEYAKPNSRIANALVAGNPNERFGPSIELLFA